MMIKFFATVHKELLLLRRDPTGLMLLFVMPAILVLVITLVQNNLMKTLGQRQTDILFIDEDCQELGRRMEALLSSAAEVSLVTQLSGRPLDRAAAIKATNRGAYQLCLVIPEGITEKVKENAGKSAERALSMTGEDDSYAAGNLEIYFDPAVSGSVRSSINHLLQLMMARIEVEEKIKALARLMPDKIQQDIESMIGPAAMKAFPLDALKPDLAWDTTPLLNIQDKSALAGRSFKIPTAVQQNVPAWSLFGIFFIVLPMAGSFLKERMWGVHYRMLSLPVSYLTIAAGKLLAYMLVCLVQVGVMICMGKWVLPLMGTTAFEIGPSPGAALLLALSAILAATGYGVLLGTVARSWEQASVFGPISVVIAAAIGGIMVPVYAMPKIMQHLSLLSPLSWAQNGFLDIFVRGENIRSVLGNVGCLTTFAAICLVISWMVFVRRTGNPQRQDR